jgi:Family of unknown function (DUF6510)
MTPPRSVRNASVPRGDDVADRWLDGNALAGVFTEALGAELTGAPRRCASCGQVNAVGAHRVYRSAGFVLRCPACGDVAAQIALLPDRTVLRLYGTWELELPGGDQA